MPTLSSNFALGCHCSLSPCAKERYGGEYSVWAVAPSAKRPITVHTKHSEPFWVGVSPQPSINARIAYLPTVRRAVAVSVINGQKFQVRFSAASTRGRIATIANKCRCLISTFALSFSRTNLVWIFTVTQSRICPHLASIGSISGIVPRSSARSALCVNECSSCGGIKLRFIKYILTVRARLLGRHPVVSSGYLVAEFLGGLILFEVRPVSRALTCKSILAREIFSEMIKRLIVLTIPTPFCLQSACGKIIFAWNHAVLHLRAMWSGVVERFMRLTASLYLPPILARRRVRLCLP